jgi:membrane-bound metal-dependent hydrolase YbcI (DUF457 family)
LYVNGSTHSLINLLCLFFVALLTIMISAVETVIRLSGAAVLVAVGCVSTRKLACSHNATPKIGLP